MGQGNFFEALFHSLRRKLNGSQGILDLMGQAAGHFLPGGELFCLDQFRQIIQDNEIFTLFLKGNWIGGDGGGQVQLSLASLEGHLLAIGAV